MTALEELRDRFRERHTRLNAYEPGERVLQAMAILCDVMRVREVGNNRGRWVEAFLASCGIGPGNAWCAASVAFACDALGVKRPAGADGARVMGWARWANLPASNPGPARGRLALASYGGGKGHIGIVVKVVGPWVYSIEGNTSPGESGSQRDGQGMYRRVRLKSFWNHGFIDLK